MKDQIKHYHRYEYVHLKCCYQNLYDVKLRIEFLDYLILMKKHPMSHQLSLFQQISFYLNQIHYFIYEVDLELLIEALDSVKNTYHKLIDLHADEELIKDYKIILNGIQTLLIKRGYLD